MSGAGRRRLHTSSCTRTRPSPSSTAPRRPLELAAAAAALGYPALALTDHDGLWGSMEFAQACQRPRPAPDHRRRADRRLALPMGRQARTSDVPAPPDPAGRGRARVSQPLPAADRSPTRTPATTQRGPRTQPWATLEQVEEHAEGLVCLSGCARDGALAGAWERGDTARGERLGRRLLARLRAASASGSSCSGPTGAATAPATAGSPCSPSGSASPPSPPATSTPTTAAARRLQDALVAVRLRRDAGGVRAAAGAATAARRWSRRRRWRRASPSTPRRSPRPSASPSACASTSPTELGYRYPRQDDRRRPRARPSSAASGSRERYAGSPRRARGRGAGSSRSWRRSASSASPASSSSTTTCSSWPARSPSRSAAAARPARVLPPGRGRGSSVSSIVCYLTGLSHIDPVKADLFAGRFLNDEATSMPDIDLDFPRDIREVLIPRVHERLRRRPLGPGRRLPDLPPARRRPRPRQGAGAAAGGDRARWRRRSASTSPRPRSSATSSPRSAPSAPPRRAGRRCCGSAPTRSGLPRHASQHPGGMVISTEPLIDVCPVVPAAMAGRQIVQWDKDSCADAGFLKIDLLGLGMLSAVERCVDEVGDAPAASSSTSRGSRSTTSETFESIRAAETTGVFQIESRAQMQMLPRTQPREPRRPHRAGGAGAAGADPGRRRPSLYREAQAAARGPRLRGPLRAPAAGAGAGGDAGDDRLPGAGDRGGDGARRLHLLARPRGCGGR